jgi:hypothetical protein
MGPEFTLSIHRYLRRVPCDCPVDCGWVHRRLTGRTRITLSITVSPA